MIRVGSAVLAIGLGLCASAAHATQAGQTAMQNWAAMDQCERNAQAAFPDYSAEALAKRDAALNECLERKSLPPRTPLAPGH